MNEITVATARDESPVLFPVPNGDAFGVLTRPTTDANGICVVILAGKGPSIASVGRGRMSPLLARRLAGLGFHSFRIDYTWTGDSSGPEWEWRITHPHTDEIRAGLSWLRQQGISRFVLAGTCGGARVALEAARDEEGVVGVVFLLPPLRDSEPWRRYDTLPTRHMLQRLLKRRHLVALRDKGRRRMYIERARSDIFANLPAKMRKGRSRGGEAGSASGLSARDGHPEAAAHHNDAEQDPRYQWIGPGALQGLEDLVGKQIPILMFFGNEDNDFGDWDHAAKGVAAPVIERAQDLIKVEMVAGRFYNTPSTVMSPRIAAAIADMVDRPDAGASR